MTRKEAIDMLYGMKADNLNLDDAYTKDKYDALDMAIKALEQEPNWDRLYSWLNDMRLGIAPDETVTDIDERNVRTAQVDLLDEIMEWIEKHPQEKIGHWIADVDKWGDIVTTVNGYRCDKCSTFNSDKDNYCPNCGAKMVEPQERSEE